MSNIQNVNQVAGQLNCSPSVVLRLVSDGLLSTQNSRITNLSVKQALSSNVTTARISKYRNEILRNETARAQHQQQRLNPARRIGPNEAAITAAESRGRLQESLRHKQAEQTQLEAHVADLKQQLQEVQTE